MLLRVLGSAAGGGFPQWNCACDACRKVREGSPHFEARTQDSISVGASDGSQVLVNASPDVLAQIARTPALQPREGRASPIKGVVLTNGDLDHCLGLLALRESTPLTLYATRAVYDGLWNENVFFRTLERFDGHVRFVPLELGRETSILPGVGVTPFALQGKVPKHLEGRRPPSPEENVGLVVRDEGTGKKAVYASAAVNLTGLAGPVEDASVLLFDGTFWKSDELIALGVSTARAEDMAHLPIGGERGTLATLPARKGLRRIFTHINNTNPILDASSNERRAVESAGWEVARDGMEIAP